MQEYVPTLLTRTPAVVVAPLCALALSLVFIASGRRILRLMSIPTHGLTTGEHLVIALGLGVGALQFLPFALGSAGWLSVTSLRVTSGIVALLLLPDIAATIAETRRACVNLRPSEHRWALILMATLLPAVGSALLVAITPTLDPDGLSYHLTVPKRWILSGSLGYLPTYPYSNTPMGVEMLFALGLAWGGDAAAKLLHFVLGVASALAIYHAGVRLRSKALGVVSAVLLLAGPAGVSKFIGLAYVEGATAFAMAVATLAWLHWFQSRNLRWLNVAAVLLGVAISFKLTAIVFGAALFALTVGVLFDQYRRTRTPPLGFAGLAALTICVLLPVLPWFVRSTILTGNPFFPLFAQFIPTRDFSPVTATMFDSYNRYYLWASRYGLAWSIELRRTILLVAMLVVFAISLFAYFRTRSFLVRVTALTVGSITILQLTAAGLYIRYWIPILPVLLLPCLVWVEGLVLRAQYRWLLVVVAALGSLVQARATLASIAYDVPGAVRTIAGLQPSTSFLRQHLLLYPLYDQINRDLPAEARVALSYSCRGFHIDRTTFCVEFPQDALTFHDWESFSEQVRQLGVTHVVAPVGVANGQEFPGPDYSAPAMMFRDRENAYLHRLLSTQGRLLGTAADQGLYALEAAPATRTP